MNKIKNVIDNYFSFITKLGGPTFIEDLIPVSMIDKTKISEYEEIACWMPIPSTVSNTEIKELEIFFGTGLPASYKFFIQYKHFIELNIGAYSISFFKNLPETFVEDTIAECNEFYVDLMEKNFIPFAKMNDQGVLCFDTNILKEKYDYAIVSFDLYDGEVRPKKYASNFLAMFDEFEEHLEDWITNVNEK